MDAKEILRLQTYLRKVFGLDSLTVRRLGSKGDSAEVYIGDESVGVLSRDDEDGDVSYAFQMAILDFDLQESEADG